MENLQLIVPQDLATLALPDPNLLLYYKDLESRRIWLNGEIDQNLITEMCQHIINWNQEDKSIEPNLRKPIIVIFDSPGGRIEYYQMAKDVFALSLTPIIGINVSQAASAAALLFLFCHKRYSLPSATFLYHYGSISLSGDAKNSIEIMKAYEKEIEEFVDIIGTHSTYTPDYIKEKMTLDWEIKADEALEHKIIENFVTDINLFWGD